VLLLPVERKRAGLERMGKSSEIDSKRLNEWLQATATTEDQEVDCDALSDVIEGVVEAALSGADVRSLLPHIAVHLDHCPDCRDWYETLLALAEEEQ